MLRSLFILGSITLSAAGLAAWLDVAFYPTLLFVLVIASLGIPIPEDIPLIAAGVILRTHPDSASWAGTILVALCGIMTGDTILYTLGHRWGRDVFAHPSVAWLITRRRLAMMTVLFHRYGMLLCFFGRLVVGVRAAMCLTGGITRYPFWKFILADLLGALVSIPLFVFLGYLFAGVLPTLRTWVAGVQGGILVAAVVLVGGLAWYAWRQRRLRRERRRAISAAGS